MDVSITAVNKHLKDIAFTLKTVRYETERAKIQSRIRKKEEILLENCFNIIQKVGKYAIWMKQTSISTFQEEMEDQ